MAIHITLTGIVSERFSRSDNLYTWKRVGSEDFPSQRIKKVFPQFINAW